MRHTHSSNDHRVGGFRIICIPRGYQTAATPQPENPRFDPARVVVVALADQNA